MHETMLQVSATYLGAWVELLAAVLPTQITGHNKLSPNIGFLFHANQPPALVHFAGDKLPGKVAGAEQVVRGNPNAFGLLVI